ncbi:MAG TPA: hypothetical protein GXZ52_00650 [Clostridiales bacterium]|nr:hypothetical protein [Clostridiales bacterium]
MRDLVGIRKYGSALTLYSDACPEGRKARGFIQPIVFSDTEKLDVRSQAGSVNRCKYLLIAEAGALLPGEKNVSVSSRDWEYSLLRAQPIYVGGRLSHWEGVLRPKGGGGAHA